MSTVPAPMVESNRSLRPFLQQMFRSPAMFRSFSAKVSPANVTGATFASVTSARACFSAPLEFRNSRLMSTMVWPFHVILSRGSSVTSATTVASRFSALA